MPAPALRSPRSPRVASVLAWASPRLRRIRAVARRAADLFPFTPLGVVTVATSAVVLFRYGIARVDLLYLVIGAVGLGLCAICLVLSVAATLRLRLGLRSASASALRVECGVRTATGFSLPALRFLPMVRPSWAWTRPEGVVRPVAEHGRLREEVTPARRGLTESIERRIEVSDAFALTRVAFRHREMRAVRAAPATGALDRLQLSRSVAGGEDVHHPEGPAEGERIDLRGYAPGDPIRFVLWKVFARSRQLVVRTPERALSPVRRGIAYLITGRGDEAAAGVARRAAETGALGASFVLGADGVATDARSPDEAVELLARSASPPGSREDGAGEGSLAGGTGLAAFLDRASPSPVVRAVIFVPAFAGPWVARVVAAVRAKSGAGRLPMQIVVCADGLDREPPRSLLRRLLVAGGGAPARGDERPRVRDVEALVRSLGASGAEVVLVDRVQGRLYAGAVLDTRSRESPPAVAKASAPRPAPAPPAPPAPSTPEPESA